MVSHLKWLENISTLYSLHLQSFICLITSIRCQIIFCKIFFLTDNMSKEVMTEKVRRNSMTEGDVLKDYPRSSQLGVPVVKGDFNSLPESVQKFVAEHVSVRFNSTFMGKILPFCSFNFILTLSSSHHRLGYNSNYSMVSKF